MRGGVVRLAARAIVIAKATRQSTGRKAEPLGQDPDAEAGDELEQVAAERAGDERHDTAEQPGEQDAEQHRRPAPRAPSRSASCRVDRRHGAGTRWRR